MHWHVNMLQKDLLDLKSGTTNTIYPYTIRLNQLAALFHKLGKKIPDTFSATEAQIHNITLIYKIDIYKKYIFLQIKICILH